MPEYQSIEWKESWHDEFWNESADMQMLMAERSISAKMIAAMLLD